MTILTTEFIGRPIEPCQSNSEVTYDKWALIDDLTKASADFGLNHRAIAVLRVMLTFVPQRDIPARLGASIVFASNQTLCERLGGMPESTLRRHIATLVKSGVIVRRDSPNRKRFVKRIASVGVLAFGFDLGPLAIMAHDIRNSAQETDRRSERREALHCAVLTARQNLIEMLSAQNIDVNTQPEFSPLIAKTRLILRHKDNADALEMLLTEYASALETIKMSGADIENERHQHKEKNKNSDLQKLSADNSQQPSLHQFTEYQKLFPDTARDWSTLSRQISQLVPMLGIDQPVYEEAKRYLGHQSAIVVMLGILEIYENIENPGGYLRRLSQQGRAGTFQLSAFLDRIVS